jgi:Zn-dependent peptidase ImmA (M78 family)
MSVEARMKDLLARMDFDFSQFTMDSFTTWVQQQVGRKIRFVLWEMPPGMFGVWLSDAEEPVEYVFIDKNVSPLHQAHIQLHELGHIVCGHPTMRLTKTQMSDLLTQAEQEPSILKTALLRSPAKEELEQEAETFAALIQHQVISHERLQQLSVAASSNEQVVDHLQSLELI